MHAAFSPRPAGTGRPTFRLTALRRSGSDV
jgi:hypothetical protein